MLRTATEMNAETKEAFENMIMTKVDEEAKNKKYSATFATKDIPEWLGYKLVTFGYKLKVDEDLISVLWENPTDAE